MTDGNNGGGTDSPMVLNKAFHGILDEKMKDVIESKSEKRTKEEKTTSISKAFKRKQIQLVVEDRLGNPTFDKDGNKITRLATKDDVHQFFSGAITDCLEQCFNAHKAMRERQEMGVSADKICSAAATIISQNIGKCVHNLTGEAMLTLRQKHVLALLSCAAEKFDALHGADPTDEDVQIAVVKLIASTLYAFHHVLYPTSNDKHRRRVISDYRAGRDRSYRREIKSFQNPVVGLHKVMFKPIEEEDNEERKAAEVVEESN